MQSLTAHAKKRGNKTIKQTLKAHSENTAKLCGSFLKGIGLYHTGYTAGYLHDMGKADKSFQERCSESEEKINHTSAAVRYIQDELGKDAFTVPQLFARDLISYAAGAHHSLFDCTGPYEKDGFQAKKERAPTTYDDIVADFFYHTKAKDVIEYHYQEAEKEIEAIYQKVMDMPVAANNRQRELERSYILGFIERILLSALTDADRIDTYCFLYDMRYDYPADIWTDLSKTVNKRYKDEDSNEAATAARKSCDMYSINMPAKASKVQKTLMVALNAAANSHRRHVIYVARNISECIRVAEEVKDITDLDAFLDFKDEDPKDYTDESWDRVLTITTRGRFSDVLFSGTMQDIRKLHSITQSVLILDEPDNINKKLCRMEQLSVSVLCSIFRTTVILSSGCSFTKYSSGVIPAPMDVFHYNEERWNEYRRPLAEDTNDDVNASKNIYYLVRKPEEIIKIAPCLMENGPGMVLASSMCQAHRNESLRKWKETNKDGNAWILSDGCRIPESNVLIKRVKFRDSSVDELYEENFDPEYLERLDLKNLDIEESIQKKLSAMLKEDPARYGFYEDSEEWIKKEYHLMKESNKEEKKKISSGLDGFEKKVGSISLFELLTKARCFPINEKKNTNSYDHMLTQAFNSAGMSYGFSRYSEENERYQTKVIVPYMIGENAITAWEKGEEYDGNMRTLLKDYSVPIPDPRKKKFEKKGKIKQNSKGQWYLLPGLYGEYGMTL